MAGELRLTPRLCKAARALAGWGQKELSAESGVPQSTLMAFEAKGEDGRLQTMNGKAVREAFERAGLEFIPENGGGAGVRFKDRS